MNTVSTNSRVGRTPEPLTAEQHEDLTRVYEARVIRDRSGVTIIHPIEPAPYDAANVAHLAGALTTAWHAVQAEQPCNVTEKAA